ncbi:tRNA (cytidine(56)-2'-O)-methyltransferase [Thermoplasmatales archaeon ex4572_165]|nr:MAG: tRNA (cytidine(56)-2'-O)-methyltransferase [Thermoplasmatales archaeon ex4572_165]RLF58703.1 MAG: tRNA (cytidine(56)-2'-O)-methyltransferase [Thermoplasmata archaeon]
MISILRIGHRIRRDKRITTHVCLVARMFGADEILIDTKDDRIEENIRSVCKRFGGPFHVQTGINALQYVKKWKGTIVHLTMYGEKLNTAIKEIDKTKDLLVIVGAEKVPFEYYELADINVSVGNQPHSEVAALAVFLDRHTNGSWQEKIFNGKIIINPSRKGKDVQTLEDELDDSL